MTLANRVARISLCAIFGVGLDANFHRQRVKNSWLMCLVVHYHTVSSYRAFGKFREHSGG